MVEFVLDISRWQGNNPDMARVKADGVVGVIAKATQGAGWVDPMFRANLDRCRANGLLFAAYHYQENTPAAGQVANIKRVVPRDVPVCPDVETGSGSVGITREIVRLLRAEGYTVPLSYIPRWYWQQIGSPSLAGLPPLWSSRYPDNNIQPYRQEFAEVPASYWDGYGGLPVALLQFTSSARVGGYAPLDCNAFRGTYQQLAALFNGEDEDMPSAKEIVDEFLSRDIYELPFKHPENQHLRFKYYMEFLGRSAHGALGAAGAARNAVAALAGEVAALKEAQRQHNAGGAIDYAKVAQAAEAGAKAALETSVVDVDITIADKTGDPA